ncbi:MAG: four helix bundle protein [Saprospiraceae bacterium]|nr:four helix bundle protein [Saprospiraceae bacterium]
MDLRKDNLVLEKSFQFSLDIIKYVEKLEAERKFIVANQLLKSGTSIGANIFEAQDAESNADFIHKLKIASKELSETFYWLKLCNACDTYPNCDDLIEKLENISKILNKIISTLKIKNKQL